MMNFRKDALAQASSYILVTTIITAVLGFAYWVIAARAYPASQVGAAAVSVSVMTLASLLAGLGTTTAPVQRIPARNPGREWSLTVTVGLALAGTAGLVAGALSWIVVIEIFPEQSLRTPLYALVLVGGVMLNSCIMALDSIWVVERATQVRLMSATLLGASKIPLLLLPALQSRGAVGIQAGWTVGLLAAVVLSLSLLVRHRRYMLSLDGFWSEVREMRRSLTGNYVVDVGTNIPTYAVPVIVGAVVSASNAAYFYSAWRVGTLFFVASSAVTTALFAEGSRVPDQAIRKARGAILVLVPLLFVATGVLALAGPTILSVFGAQYREYGYLLLVLVIGATVPDALTAVFRTVLRLRRRYGYAAAFMWGMAVLQIALTWELLHVWGIAGAGAAWLFAESVGVAVAAVDSLWTGYQRGRPGRMQSNQEGG